MKHKLGATHRNGDHATYRCNTCRKLMRFDTDEAPFYCPRCSSGILQKVKNVTPEMEAEHETHAEETG